ncbi:MAG: hypothetical protein EOO40_01425 [Deltaproteobacteria bacterium]|nr:MAG: hypothetical protein EOO40_01425 [Deltaproteobacteria bacterium]
MMLDDLMAEIGLTSQSASGRFEDKHGGDAVQKLMSVESKQLSPARLPVLFPQQPDNGRRDGPQGASRQLICCAAAIAPLAGH